MTALPAREGYALWAPSYQPETAVSALEDRLVTGIVTPVGRRLLDAGCGTGRRLARAGAALGVGVDLTPEMLVADEPHAAVAAADVRALPFAADTFDLVWCRLVIGHLPDPAPVYAELARVCSAGGTVIVTDFHPAATAAGHRRTFRDGSGTLHELEHHSHLLADHLRHAGQNGLQPVTHCDGTVGPRVRPFYARAGKLDAYRAQLGLPIVLALAFRKG